MRRGRLLITAALILVLGAMAGTILLLRSITSTGLADAPTYGENWSVITDPASPVQLYRIEDKEKETVCWISVYNGNVGIFCDKE